MAPKLSFKRLRQARKLVILLSRPVEGAMPVAKKSNIFDIFSNWTFIGRRSILNNLEIPEEMRNLSDRVMFDDAIEEIRQAIPKMTPQQQKVGIYFCEHPDEVGDLSLSDFAVKIGTSGPSVNRFCKSMGYGGFLDFSRTMASLKTNTISHASFFRGSRIRNQKGDVCLGRELLEKDCGNIRKLIEGYPAEKIAACAALMSKSSSISVIGRMSAYPAAVYFEQLLAKTTRKLVPMSGGDVLQAAALSRLDGNSLVFCLAFPRYPKSVVELAKETALRGASIVAITKDEHSPLAEIGNLVFTLDVDIYSYIDLLGPVFALINVLCLEFGLVQGDQSEKSLLKYDRVVEDVYFMTGRKKA